MKQYRIMNRISKEWYECGAESAQEACKQAGWLIGDCWVRAYSPKGSGGWKTPEELNKEGGE